MKIKVVCRKDVIYKNGKSQLSLRFTHQRASKYVALGLSVEPRYWDFENQMLTADCPERRTLQSKIDNAIEAYNKKIKRLEALEIEVNFNALFEVNGHRMVIAVEDGFKREIERLEALGKYSSVSKHKSTLASMSAYKSTKIALEAINMDYLKGFEAFLRERGNNDNSIATRFAIFKAIYNKAIKERLIVPKQNPFIHYKVGSLWTPTRKRAISKEDIQKVIELEIPYNYRSDYKRLARDLFLFSYFTAGMNFGDMARLQHKDVINDRIYYSRHKTQKLLSCKLTEQSRGIMARYSDSMASPEDYIFPILDRKIHITEKQKFHRIVKSLRKVNSALKEIGEDVGLQFPLTTYVARHTYATVLKRSGVNIAIISETLGHSDISTTQIYLDSFEDSQIDEAMKHLL